MMLIAQLSDLHLTADAVLGDGRVDTVGLFARSLDHLLGQPVLPDVVLLTGDLTDRGRPADYVCLAEMLDRLPMPVYLLPGNHDDREHLKACFLPRGHDYMVGAQALSPFIQYPIVLGDLQVLCLDSVVPEASAGLLCAQRLAWLSAALAASSRPTILALHHPPFETGIDAMDAINLRNADELAVLVSQFPHVQRVLCGHVHRAILSPFAHTHASSCPSAAHQIHLDLRPEARGAYTLEPSGYQLHLWKNQRLITHTVSTVPFAGPYFYG